jgi:hypothetical protein
MNFYSHFHNLQDSCTEDKKFTLGQKPDQLKELRTPSGIPFETGSQQSSPKSSNNPRAIPLLFQTFQAFSGSVFCSPPCTIGIWKLPCGVPPTGGGEKVKKEFTKKKFLNIRKFCAKREEVVTRDHPKTPICFWGPIFGVSRIFISVSRGENGLGSSERNSSTVRNLSFIRSGQ